MLFRDRVDAGEQLVPRLKQYANQAEVIVLGLPRGGVVTAAVIAKTLKLPLDIIVPRKIGAPMNEELALGAVAEEGAVMLDERLTSLLGVSREYLDATVEKERVEAARRLHKYRGNRPPLNLNGKTAIIVDDGVATGATMRAAIASAKAKGARRVIAATPVIAPDTLVQLQREADEVVYLEAPSYFSAVGQFYEKFEQTEDEQVVALLHKIKKI